MRDPNTVFSSETGVTYYDELLSNRSYMEKKYLITSEIKHLTPYQYYLGASDLFNTSVEQLKRSRERDPGLNYIEELEKVIKDPFNQFPLTYIDYINKNQEGLHRMYVLGELYGWNKVKFPVLIVSRTEEQEKKPSENELEEKVWIALQESLKPEYLNVDEFIQEFKDNIKREIKEDLHPSIKYDGNKVSVNISTFYYEYTDVKVKFESKEDRDRDFEKWMKSFNEEWNKDYENLD